jgi:hypothetical protein
MKKAPHHRGLTENQCSNLSHKTSVQLPDLVGNPAALGLEVLL